MRSLSEHIHDLQHRFQCIFGIDAFLKFWLSLNFLLSADAANKMQDWPTQGFTITTSRTELHSQAGVLLYEDTHGGFEAMRKCIAQQISTRR